MSMMVRLMVPSGMLLEQEAAKVIAEAHNGSFCLLPRHVDFVAALVPGILALTMTDGAEIFFAVDEGILVKRGAQVQISTWNAVQGILGKLRQTVHEQFRELDDSERQARSALDRLEASLVRQLIDWKGQGHA